MKSWVASERQLCLVSNLRDELIGSEYASNSSDRGTSQGSLDFHQKTGHAGMNNDGVVRKLVSVSKDCEIWCPPPGLGPMSATSDPCGHTANRWCDSRSLSRKRLYTSYHGASKFPRLEVGSSAAATARIILAAKKSLNRATVAGGTLSAVTDDIW